MVGTAMIGKVDVSNNLPVVSKFSGLEVGVSGAPTGAGANLGVGIGRIGDWSPCFEIAG